MNPFAFRLQLLLAASIAMIPQPKSSAATPPPTTAPPNIVFIVADDLGYSELACFGQTKIRTPSLDRLAAQGMRFTQHYAGNAVCAPSRCVLMTGLHPGHAQIRDNREIQPEGQLPLAPGTATLPRLLQRAGYVTGAFGKWGLGPVGSSGDPLHQGFNHFFGYICQRAAHNHFPPYLYEDGHKVPLPNPDFSPHQKLPDDADPTDLQAYAAYQATAYAPDHFMAAAREFIRRNREHPFFCYIPTTVPHLALQVPQDSLAEYRNAFPDDPPYTGDKGYLPHPKPRAAYAAMITRLDHEIGRLVELIEELNLTDRTLFIFTSDNGPAYDRLGGTDSEFFHSTGPFRGLKGSLHEGGVRVPLIVRWPGHVPAATTNNIVCGFEDWLPTLITLAGAPHQIPPHLDGVDLSPAILGRHQPERPYLYREFPGYGGQQFIRSGDWKLIRSDLSHSPDIANDSPPQLYNLSNDPGETQNLASQQPAIADRLNHIMLTQHVPSAAFPFPSLDRAAPPVTPAPNSHPSAP